MKGKGPGEEDKGGERGGGSAAVSSKFVGHTDMKDEEAKKEAKRLAGLLVMSFFLGLRDQEKFGVRT